MGKHIDRHIETLASSPDGGLIVGASSLTNRSWKGSLSYFEKCDEAFCLEQHQAFAELDSGLSHIEWIPRTGQVIVACDSGAVEMWKLSVEKDNIGCVARTFEHDNMCSTLSINSNATKLCSGDHSGSVNIWDVEEFKPLSSYKVHSDVTWCTVFHHSSAEIFSSCSQDGRVFIWDLRQTKPASKLESDYLQSTPTCLAWQPECEHSIAVGTETGQIVSCDTRFGVGRPVTIDVHERRVHRIAFSSHASRPLGSVSSDGTAAVVDCNETKSTILCRFSQHKDFVRDLSWLGATNSMVTCSWDGTVKLNKVGQDICNSS